MTNQELMDGIEKLDADALSKILQEQLAAVATTRKLLGLAKVRQKPGRQRAVGTRKARTPKAAGNGVPAAAETEV